MDLEPDLQRELDRAIPHLPAVPGTAYLAAGRRYRRRRRAYAGVAGVAVVALVGGVAASATGGGSPAPASPTATQASESPGADDIPAWAEEYGNHGPVSIYPSGELWVAPDARLIRHVEIPAGAFDGDVMRAYAAEAEIDGEVWWSFVFRTSAPGDRPGGQMEPARAWTTDFDVWVDYITADMQGRPRFSERLVRFADDDSEELVAREGARIVDQTDDVGDLPGYEDHPRRSAAEVEYAGRTWFVLAQGPRSGRPFYTPYQAETVPVPDVDGFLDHLRDGARR